MKRIVKRIRIFLHKKHATNPIGSKNINNTDMRSTSERAIAICKSKRAIQKMHDNITDVWIMCMEPFM